jgi:ESCRT-II complex subunit VPS36
MMENSAITAEGAVSNAFTDLDALMRAAGTMVALAADLNDRLTSAQAASAAQHIDAPVENEEATFIRSSLVQLGLALPGGAVTKDMAADDHKWHVELSRELAALLQGGTSSSSTTQAGIMNQKPIIPLDEVWGAWNRARGVALLPPATLLAVLPLLPAATSPTLADRTLKSGLRVLHTPEYGPAAFATRVAASLGSDVDLTASEEESSSIRGGGKTTAEIAHAEKLTVALARELVEEAEERGMFMREDAKTRLMGSTAGGPAQVKWWPNLVKGWTWDGQEHEAE